MNRFNDIRRWAEQRDIIIESSPKDQFVKLMEEIGELAESLSKPSKGDLLPDAIGDAVVVLTILAAQHEYCIEDCIEAAWEEIKDRKGKMRDGVFIKEEDLELNG